LPSGANLTATIDGRFATSRWIAADFVAAEDAPGYFTEDALLSYSSATHRWSVSVFGRNLSNRAIYNGGIQSPFTAGFVTATLEPPRTYGARASVSF
jgi:iron complex outermembrane receptor protein